MSCGQLVAAVKLPSLSLSSLSRFSVRVEMAGCLTVCEKRISPLVPRTPRNSNSPMRRDSEPQKWVQTNLPNEKSLGARLTTGNRTPRWSVEMGGSQNLRRPRFPSDADFVLHSPHFHPPILWYDKAQWEWIRHDVTRGQILNAVKSVLR